MHSANPRTEPADPCCRIDERVIRLREPFAMHCGARLTEMCIGMRAAGPVDAPVVVALGGISASRRAVCADHEDGAGWWQGALGSDGADLLADRRVLGFDWLGGCGDTTGPRNWGASPNDFPAVDTRDQARLLARLLDELGIDRVEALISASYGGMVAQHFAAECSERVERVLVIGCAHRPEPMAVARRYVQKRILGLAGVDEAEAVAVARALAMTTYRSAMEFRSRFGGPGGRESLQRYLDYQGDKFAERFDVDSALRLMDSIDAHGIDPARIAVPLTVLGFSTDELCPPELLGEFAERAGATERAIQIDSPYGHDAFLCEAQAVASTIRQFLEGGRP